MAPGSLAASPRGPSERGRQGKALSHTRGASVSPRGDAAPSGRQAGIAQIQPLGVPQELTRAGREFCPEVKDPGSTQSCGVPPPFPLRGVPATDASLRIGLPSPRSLEVELPRLGPALPTADGADPGVRAARPASPHSSALAEAEGEGTGRGPAGKGEAGPGRATRDASRPRGPSRWTAPRAGPTGTSEQGCRSRGRRSPGRHPRPRPQPGARRWLEPGAAPGAPAGGRERG